MKAITWITSAFCACVSLAAAASFVVRPAAVALVIGVLWAVFALLSGMAATRAKR